MQRVFVRDMRPGQDVAGTYVVRDRALRPFKNKPGQFMTATLADRTGEIDAVIWDNAEEAYVMIREGAVAMVKGTVKDYKGEGLQVHIGEARPVRDEEINPADFVPEYEGGMDVLKREFAEIAASVSNAHLAGLLAALLADQDWLRSFTTAPAAVSVHHAYIGGLLHHSVNVAKLCDRAASLYSQVDRDLLVTGAILHDVGKIEEYGINGGIVITDLGKLIGHIVLGERMVAERIRSVPGFPWDLELKLRHMILSHHGEHEYGSPKLPSTVEAVILHEADNMDAKAAQAVSLARDWATGESRWTPFDRRFGREFFVGRGPAYDASEAGNASRRFETVEAPRAIGAAEVLGGEASQGREPIEAPNAADSSGEAAGAAGEAGTRRKDPTLFGR